MSRSDDPRSPDRLSPDRHSPDRRRFLLTLAKAGATAPFLAAPLLTAPFVTGAAFAQMSHDQDSEKATMSMGAGHPIGLDVLPATDAPWQDGRCAFCNMTIATPEGGALPPGFRERTYAQMRLADDAGGEGTQALHFESVACLHNYAYATGFRERTYAQMRLADDAGGEGTQALHFESVACLHNYAYATGVRDGHGATFYVADAGAPQAPQHGLMLSREATYLWAEGLRVSMAARMAAYPNDDAAVAALARLDAPGRHRLLDAVTIADLAPLPEMNLIALLARASGLLDG